MRALRKRGFKNFGVSQKVKNQIKEEN